MPRSEVYGGDSGLPQDTVLTGDMSAVWVDSGVAPAMLTAPSDSVVSAGGPWISPDFCFASILFYILLRLKFDTFEKPPLLWRFFQYFCVLDLCKHTEQTVTDSAGKPILIAL